MSPDETYQQARTKARRRPAWWLRRRDAQIVATRPQPSTEELAELRAIRRELRIRSVRRAPLRWWVL
jgi:hypothetical protein